MTRYLVMLVGFLTTLTWQTFGIKQILTFMTQKKTWNEGSLVCNMNGGYLYKDGSAAVSTTVGELGDMEPWLSQAYIDDQIWIGLGFSGTTDPAGDPIYTWNSDCVAMDNSNHYSDWHPSEPKFPISRECIYRKRAGSNWNWYTSTCSAGKYYICQTEAVDPCSNSPVNGVRGAESEDESYSGVTLYQCDTHCTDAKCVAYSFHSGTGQCYIYTHYGILHFEDPSNQQADAGYVLYLMGCFEAAIDGTFYNVVNGNSGVDVQCAALTNAVVTTTTTPTTLEPTPTTTTSTTLEPTPTTTTSTTLEPTPTTTTSTTLEPTPTTTTSTTTLPITMSSSTSLMVTFSTASSNLCQCMCTLHHNSTSADDDIVEKIATLQSKLAVNTSALSSTKRRLTCADDSRVSSTCIGVVAVIFLAFCFGLVLVADTQSICVAHGSNKKGGANNIFRNMMKY